MYADKLILPLAQTSEWVKVVINTDNKNTDNNVIIFTNHLTNKNFSLFIKPISIRYSDKLNYLKINIKSGFLFV